VVAIVGEVAVIFYEVVEDFASVLKAVDLDEVEVDCVGLDAVVAWECEPSPLSPPAHQFVLHSYASLPSQHHQATHSQRKHSPLRTLDDFYQGAFLLT